MNAEPTDLDLLKQASAGDGDAFARLFRRHRDRVFRHTLRLASTPSDAEDLVALTFAEVWRRRKPHQFGRRIHPPVAARHRVEPGAKQRASVPTAPGTLCQDARTGADR